MPEYTIPLDYKLTWYRNAVHTLQDAGAEIPSRWLELDANLAAYLQRPFTAAERLAQQVVQPVKSVDVDLLRAQALVEQTAGPQSSARILHVIASRVRKEMDIVYEASARSIYAGFASRFNELADSFHTLVDAADLEAPADEMAEAADNIRLPWIEGQRVATRLEQLIKPLQLAAQLAGTRLDAHHNEILDWTEAPLSDDAVIALFIDQTSKPHRRRLAEAWHATGARTGRWQPMAQAARLKAADLDTFARLEPLKPLVHKQVPDGPGRVTNIALDPHDPGYREPMPTIDPVRGGGGVFAG